MTEQDRNATTLILVRHGETEGNVQQVWQGAMDVTVNRAASNRLPPRQRVWPRCNQTFL